MIHESVSNLVAPVNELVFKNLYLFLCLAAVILVFVFLGKLRDHIIYKKHKNDVRSTTNDWWSWEEYEEEKKNRK